MKKVAEKDIVFFFVTPEMICEDWNIYIKESLGEIKDKDKDIIPVALNGKSLNFSLYDSMIKKHFVRLDDLKTKKLNLKVLLNYCMNFIRGFG